MIVAALYAGSFFDREHGHVLRRPVHIGAILVIGFCVALFAVTNLGSKPNVERGRVAEGPARTEVHRSAKGPQNGRAAPATSESTAQRATPDAPAASESAARRNDLELWRRLTQSEGRETRGHSALANGQQHLDALELRRAREAFLAARDYFRRDPPERRSVEDRRGEGLALFALGRVERRADNTDGATAILGEAGELLRRIGDKAARLASALAAIELADAGHERNRESAARAGFLEAIASIELGTVEGALEWSHAAARSLLRYARFEVERENYGAAATALDKAATHANKATLVFELATVHLAQAELALAQRRFDEARSLIASVRAGNRTAQWEIEGDSLILLGRVALAQNDAEQAPNHFVAARRAVAAGGELRSLAEVMPCSGPPKRCSTSRGPAPREIRSSRRRRRRVAGETAAAWPKFRSLPREWRRAGEHRSARRGICRGSLARTPARRAPFACHGRNRRIGILRAPDHVRARDGMARPLPCRRPRRPTVIWRTSW